MRSIDFRTLRFGLPTGPAWLAVLAAFAVLTFAAQANAGGWVFTDGHRTGWRTSFTYYFKRPPICQRVFSTSEDALNCLRGEMTDPHYVKAIGNTENNTSAYGNFYEKYNLNLQAVSKNGFLCKGVTDVATATICYAIEIPLGTKGMNVDGVVTLVDGSGRSLNNKDGDRQLWFWNRNPDNWSYWSGDVSGYSSFYTNSRPNADVSPFARAETAAAQMGTFGLAYIPNAVPGNGGESCVGKYDYVPYKYSEWAAFPGGKGPPIGMPYYYRDKLCDYDMVDLNDDPKFKNAGYLPAGYPCFTPTSVGSSTLCVVKGVSDISETVPPRTGSANLEDSIADGSGDGPLVITIGKETQSAAVIKEPTIAELALGWGNALAPVTLGLSQLAGVIPLMVQEWENGLEERQWKLLLAYMQEDLIDVVFGYEAYREANDFYHPGNYDAKGGYIGAFDRDWGKTDYAPEKAFNWDKDVPATQVSKDMLEVVAKNPTTSRDQVVTKPTYTGSTPVKYPPGVPGDDGTVTPPGPGNGGDGDGWPSVGDWLGTYESKGSLYTSKYPDGLGGVINDTLKDAQAKSGASEIIGLIAFEGHTTIVGDLCYEFPLEILGYDFSSSGNRGLCIPDSLLNMMKALFIVGAGIYAIYLIFGGD